MFRFTAANLTADAIAGFDDDGRRRHFLPIAGKAFFP
jgi:hypothetical protein